MENWLIAVKILSGICALLIMLASWFGYDGYKQRNETQATREQMTTVINYMYYNDGCKPGGQ